MSGPDFDALRARYANKARVLYADDVGELHIDTATHVRLRAAGITTVTALAERIEAGTLEDAPGIGPGRASAIADAVGFYHERLLPLDDPELRTLAAGLATLEAIRFLTAAARLAGEPERAEAVISTAAPLARDWLRLDSDDPPGPTAPEEAWTVLRAVLRDVVEGGDGDADAAV